MAETKIGPKEIQAANKALDKMSADLKKAIKGIDEARKESALVTKLLDDTIKKFEAFKMAGPKFSASALLKKATGLGANPKETAALAAFEKTGTRDRLELAVKLVSTNKKLQPIAVALDRILKADDDAAKNLKSDVSKAEACKSDAEKILKLAESFEAIAQKA